MKTNNSIVHQFEVEKKSQLGSVFTVIFATIVIFAGITTGYVIAGRGGSFSTTGEFSGPEGKRVVGSLDKETFKDSAEGIIKKGGINGEGTHKLIRPGGESQTVYLTSSVVDLDEFVGKKVKVWGETFAAEKAGWLMDVGLVEVKE